MNKKERFDNIQKMLMSFDIQIKKLKFRYSLIDEDSVYFNISIDYTKSEGSVSMDIKDTPVLSSNFIEDLKTLYSNSFPFPYGTGN